MLTADAFDGRTNALHICRQITFFIQSVFDDNRFQTLKNQEKIIGQEL